MFKVLVIWLVLFQHGIALMPGEIKTLYGQEDPPHGRKRSFVINADEEDGARMKRAADADAGSTPASSDGIITKINGLNDTHKQLMVHWVGDKSNVIICLARDATPLMPGGLQAPNTVINVTNSAERTGFSAPNPSNVYVSYDDGNTYENKTEFFKISNGSYSTLEKFYNHPRYNTHFVFTDVKHNLMFVTSNFGKNFTMLQLNFTPSEVSFHELQPSTFVVLDKNDTKQRFWITEDFGKTFRLAHEFVKAFFWMNDTNANNQLIVQRFEPNNLSSVIYSKNLFKNRASQIYATNIKDFSYKGDYLFTTKINSKGDLVLYVSHKLGRLVPCVFNSSLKFRNYLIVDVTGNRALVAISHSDTSSNLYVSENLGGIEGEVKFTLSLEDVFAFFPGTTWQDTWLHHLSEDAFADIYKVEGLSGIYIASRFVAKPTTSNNNLGPHNLGSVITFNHGATWRPIQPPQYDVEGQSLDCLVSKNCSLHLSQKFSQLHPESRTLGILSSKSAPGIILAMGVVGKNLKGHYGVYVSLDAGLTWRQTLRDNYFFNMGDHGGIFTAVKYYRNRGETRHIEYSIDEGETWNQTEFHNEQLKLYGLMTEPGENTTVFTMFGSLPEFHQWIIVKVDLKNVFKRNCDDSDYKMWSPSQSDENRSYIPCVMGVQTTYQRRMPKAKCLNGLDFVRVMSKQFCDCDYLDFECDFGFVPVGNPPRCVLDTNQRISYDPYTSQNCKPGQIYMRTKGYRKISNDYCQGGFESHYLPDWVPCPMKPIDDFLLFAQRDHITQYNLITHQSVELPIQNLRNVIAIDYDLAGNCLYWADIALDTISRQCFSNGSEAEVLVSTDLSSIEGMAFDWMSKTLYFVDGVRSKIELIRTDINHSGRMRRTILNSTVLHKPRGIALHPQSGFMFWTDWSTENPSVNRANLDGSNNITLFGRDKVEWPNGITVDYIANRIYWVDARQDYIGSSDLHGDGFLRVVSDSTDFVSHPFAIAVFKNTMYWDDWKRNSIFSANKDVFHGVNVLVKQFPGLMDLKVFAHGIQIGNNGCKDASCLYICVGLPKNKHACLCPDGLTMKNKKCMCPGDVEPKTNLTCPTVENSCSSEHFTCGNSLCVPKGWKCDGEDDCGDNSDEIHCSSQTCPPTFHVCGDGKCLPHYWKCDYDTDCADGSDEVGCPKQNCTEDQFACENGRCISAKWKCDGENDCRDNSDERNCNADSPTNCKADEFQCAGGAITCIPTTWKCDGEPDCRDSSDEIHCDTNVCLNETQFSCGPPNNRCIYKTWVCDGDKDCADGRDEVNCTTGKPSKTDSSKIPNEFNSKNNTCQDWMYGCRNHRCIPFWWKCDGVDDCGDGSDEVGCPNSSQSPDIYTTSRPVSCDSNQFECFSGDCIFSSWVCDGMYDCTGGEDESNCEGFTNCTSNQFKCRIDGSCVPLSAVCNGRFDCPDATDELSCEHNIPLPATPSCSIGMFPCDGSCFPLALLCDHKADCKDGYDERNCNYKSRVYQILQMGVDERGITENSILLFWWIPTPRDKLEFMPSISKVGENKWQNQTWITKSDFNFTKLAPFTKYNITVYVRLEKSNTEFAPAKFLIASTSESFPSEPWNLTVVQRNGSHILLSWNKPHQPNGVITTYDICWSSPNSREVRLALSGNETSHLLSPDFEHNVTYTFWVIAHNRKYSSKKSQPAKLVFDGETNVSLIKDIVVVSEDIGKITFVWKYSDEADGFSITALANRPYPNIPPKTSKTKNITLFLAPGAHYYIEIHAFKNDLIGPSSPIRIRTKGEPIPEIQDLRTEPQKNLGTSVKLSWEKPEYNLNQRMNWTYGVYYGISQDKLFEKPRLLTTFENVTISNLEACEIYLVSVGVVEPLGYGPLSPAVQFSTSENTHAPPKRVQVGPDGDNMLKMKVTWIPSCPMVQPKWYIIKVFERSTTRTNHVKVEPTGNLSRVFNVSYGGVYDVSMSIDFAGTYTPPVTYYAPPMMPPVETEVKLYPNGSYLVNWTEPNFIDTTERILYDVFVQPGKSLNSSTAQNITVDKPPLLYTNFSSSVYTFAVRVRLANGLKSEPTKWISRISKFDEPVSKSSVSPTAIIVPCLLLLTALSAVIVFLVVKNRKLQSNFTRFTNSHYDTRSEAATFEDNGLEEEENPQIRGFADDEPLVIA